ncbi:MAG: translation initiation inhibitor [Pirellula sp.]|nr:translation initiation inhibitor [Pirellula sp.]
MHLRDIQSGRREFLVCGATAAAAVAGLGKWSVEANDDGPRKILECLDGDRESGTSRAVIVGDVPLVHTEQVFAKGAGTDADRDVVVAALEQALELRLTAADASLDSAVRLHFYVAANDWVPVIQENLAQRYAGKYQPAVTFVTGKLAEPGMMIAADCVAARRGAISAGKVARFAGTAILPAGDKLYVSGDAKPGDVPTATRATLESLEQTLRFARLDWSHVVQLKSFLDPIDAADDARKAMRDYFGDRPLPVLTFVEWESPTLPIEIELIATVPPELGNKSGRSVEFLTPPGMKASPVFSRVARLRSPAVVYTSGLYADDNANSAACVRNVLGQVRQLVDRAGGNMRQLVKATYYVAKDETSAELGKIRPEFYEPDSPPAASKAAVDGVGRDDHSLVIDMIAAAG